MKADTSSMSCPYPLAPPAVGKELVACGLLVIDWHWWERFSSWWGLLWSLQVLPVDVLLHLNVLRVSLCLVQGVSPPLLLRLFPTARVIWNKPQLTKDGRSFVVKLLFFLSKKTFIDCLASTVFSLSLSKGYLKDFIMILFHFLRSRPATGPSYHMGVVPISSPDWGKKKSL